MEEKKAKKKSTKKTTTTKKKITPKKEVKVVEPVVEEENGSKYFFGLLISLIVLVIVGIIIVNKNEKDELNENKLIDLGASYNNLELEENYIFKDYEDFKKYFKDSKLTLDDFKNNNYVLIPIYTNPCGEHDLKIKDFKLDNEHLIVNVEYEAGCGVCAPEYLYYAVSVSKELTKVNIEMHSKQLNEPNCPPNVVYKPLIYIYPEYTMDISVKLGNSNNLSFSYPRYNNGWNVKAYKDGTLIDKNTNRELYGLFWEGNNYESSIKEEGFIVSGSEALTFLEEKLEILGLSQKESEEFIIYWLPKLESNKYNYIRFASKEEIDNYMPLEITPKPETVIRLLMEYKPLDKIVKVKEQDLTKVIRKGYTVVEWGGTLIK